LTTGIYYTKTYFDFLQKESKYEYNFNILNTQELEQERKKQEEVLKNYDAQIQSLNTQTEEIISQKRQEDFILQLQEYISM